MAASLSKTDFCSDHKEQIIEELRKGSSKSLNWVHTT